MICVKIIDDEHRVKFRIIEPRDFEQTVDLCSQLFVNNEPIAKSLKITYPEFRRFAEPYCRKAIADRLSIVATDANGQIVGFVISEPLMTIPPYIQEVSPKFEPIQTFLEHLKYSYFGKYPYYYWELFRTLHIFLLGVKEEYKNKKIATNLIKENLKLAQINYFTVAISEATGLSSQNVFHKIGFQEEVTLGYDSYIFKGEKIFSSIKESPSCKLMSYRIH
jgi:ribosomal protein S18 acetylase RimI-like enzyme